MLHRIRRRSRPEGGLVVPSVLLGILMAAGTVIAQTDVIAERKGIMRGN